MAIIRQVLIDCYIGRPGGRYWRDAVAGAALLVALTFMLPRVDEVIETALQPRPTGIHGYEEASPLWSAGGPVLGSAIGIVIGVIRNQRRRGRPALNQLVAVLISMVVFAAVLTTWAGLSIAVSPPLGESPMERFLATVPDAPIVLMLGLLIFLVGLLVFLRRGGLAAGDARIDAEMEAERQERAGPSIGEAGGSRVER